MRKVVFVISAIGVLDSPYGAFQGAASAQDAPALGAFGHTHISRFTEDYAKKFASAPPHAPSALDLPGSYDHGLTASTVGEAITQEMADLENGRLTVEARNEAYKNLVGDCTTLFQGNGGPYGLAPGVTADQLVALISKAASTIHDIMTEREKAPHSYSLSQQILRCDMPMDREGELINLAHHVKDIRQYLLSAPQQAQMAEAARKLFAAWEYLRNKKLRPLTPADSAAAPDYATLPQPWLTGGPESLGDGHITQEGRYSHMKICLKVLGLPEATPAAKDKAFYYLLLEMRNYLNIPGTRLRRDAQFPMVLEALTEASRDLKEMAQGKGGYNLKEVLARSPIKAQQLEALERLAHGVAGTLTSPDWAGVLDESQIGTLHQIVAELRTTVDILKEKPPVAPKPQGLGGKR